LQDGYESGGAAAVETAETSAKARQVKDHIVAKLPDSSVEYKYIHRNPQPVGSGIEEWRPRQGSLVYVYQITREAGDTKSVEVTLDAMRHWDVTTVSGAVLDARSAGRAGPARIESGTPTAL
jgi:hypothetical protein